MRKILLVEDDENLLSSLSTFFEMAAGVECVTLMGFGAMMARKAEVLRADVGLAIIDINLGQDEPSGVDVYHWLRENHFSGQIVFLTGHAQDNPLVREATQIGEARVFAKPMDVEKLLALVKGQRKDDDSKQAG